MATTEISAEGCPIHRFTVRSRAMDRDVHTVVVLPPEYGLHPKRSYPILYTFHGMAAPFDTFSAMVPLREALAEKPMIVTCMDADHDSFYLDAPRLKKPGRNPEKESPVKSLFTTFFLNEFIPAIDKNYRVDTAKRMLTGFSMGGFGAFHYLLAAPGQFRAVSELSGWFEPFDALSERMQPILENVLGPYAENPKLYAEQDVFKGIRSQLDAGVSFPPLYLTCGTEDYLIEPNRALHRLLEKHGIGHEYIETAGGHDWPFWRDASPGIIDFHWRACQ